MRRSGEDGGAERERGREPHVGVNLVVKSTLSPLKIPRYLLRRSRKPCFIPRIKDSEASWPRGGSVCVGTVVKVDDRRVSGDAGVKVGH